MSDKNIRVLSSPDDPKPRWPTWPGYTPPWDLPKIREAVESLVAFRGSEAKAVINQSDIVDLILRILGDYNQRLSKVERELWAAHGMLEDKS